MLLNLKIKDLILVVEGEIEFGQGLNIFTGETGSGKSAILTAIRLIRGERASIEWIRAGANSAVVEATLTGPLTIRREIHRSGKSRCFVDDELVNGSVLREILNSSLDIVDQGSSGELTSSEQQRNILDTYLNLGGEAKLLFEKYEESSQVEKELKSNAASQVDRDLAWAKSRLSEIAQVNWQKEEETGLNQIHLLLTRAQELSEKVGSITAELSQLAPRARYLANLLERAGALDQSLEPSSKILKTAALELHETDHFLCSYASRLESDPLQLASIENRIGIIEALKKKFGPTWEEVEKQKLQLTQEILRLEMFDQTQEGLQKRWSKLAEETAQIASRLSAKRTIGAPHLSREILEELTSLNLVDAKFEVEVRAKELSAHGKDEIRFLFTANPHLPPSPLDAHASGGELSRLLFATKVVLAQKEKTQCLVLDEIDSNVGGQTATILGGKLEKLSKTRQVICVTHFVQVARYADHHFAVSKKDVEGKATTFVEGLDAPSRNREYARMVGNNLFTK